MFKIWGSKGTAITVPLNFQPQLSDGNANVFRRHPMPMPMPNMIFLNFRPIFLCFAKPSPKFSTSPRCFCATNTATSSPNSKTNPNPNPKEEEVEEEDAVLPKKTPPKRKKKSTTSSAANIKQLLIRSEAAQMKLNWLSSLNNNNNSHPSDDDDHVGHTTNNASSPSQWVIGIDPDVSGALALLKPLDSGFSPQVFDSPHLKVLVGKRARRRLDPKAIIQLLQSFDAPRGTIAYLEQSLPYPGDGKQGWWSGGFNYGIWIGALVALGFSVVPVPSLLWKNQFKLAGNGSSKDDSREAACTLFPSISSQLTRKKDHGRAEALLIAAYGKGLKLSSESCLVPEELMPSNLGS